MAVRKTTVLVVEDEDVLREVAVQVLTEESLEVHEAGTAEEAERIFRELCPELDLLLTDLMLPGRSGSQLASRLRASRPELKVIFTSGYEETPGAEGTPGSVFLNKPYSVRELRGTVRALVGGDDPA